LKEKKQLNGEMNLMGYNVLQLGGRFNAAKLLLYAGTVN